MKTQDTHPFHRKLSIIYILILFATLIGSIWWMRRTTQSPEIIDPNIATTEQIKKSPLTKTKETVVPKVREQSTVPRKLTSKQNPDSAQLEKSTQPQVYWLQVEDEEIRLIPQAIAIEKGVSEEFLLKKAINNLLNNSQNNRLSSTIPVGTKLLGLETNKNGIYVNLSREFTNGGGSSSMVYRVAQVLYTVSSINPQAKVC